MVSTFLGALVASAVVGAAPPVTGAAQPGAAKLQDSSVSGLGDVESSATAALDAYWFSCAAVIDGGGVLTNGSLGMVGQVLAGQMVSASYTIDVGAAYCMVGGTIEPPPDEGPMYVLWMSFGSATAVPGVGTVGTEDIVAYDMATRTWSMVFDGSDVGLGGAVIDGMAREDDGDLLLSFMHMSFVARYFVDDSDVLRFTPTTLGSSTAGFFSYLLDASDVGLSLDAEDVDAIDIAPDGRVLLSTYGAFTASSASGGGDDIIAFNAFSYGTSTFGSFSMYFDGSAVGLNTFDENVDAVAYTPDGTILLSTDGAFLVSGAAGEDEDVLEFLPTTTGVSTSGTFGLLLDLSTIGIAGSADISALEVVDP